jgi:polyhydroxybutyrate depolymerase
VNAFHKAILAIVLLTFTACNRPQAITVMPTETSLPQATPLPEPTLEPTPPPLPRPTAYDRTETIAQIDGITRTIRLYVPTSYNSSVPTPLVINMHGLNADPNQQWALSGMSAKADEEGFIVAYPLGRDNMWADGPGSRGDDDIEFIRLVIQNLQGRYNIDPRRIYATGISNGGGMANRLACDVADLIAAIGPVSGAYNFWQACTPSRPIPVIAFHGLADQIAPFEGAEHENILPPIESWAAAWAERNGCDPEPTEIVEVETVTREAWTNCEQGADVVLYRIDGMGHYWPGSDLLPEFGTQAISATDIMWDFFMVHPMP